MLPDEWVANVIGRARLPSRLVAGNQFGNSGRSTPNCDANDFNKLKEKPLIEIYVIHCMGWNRLLARVWLKIVCSVLLPAKHLIDVMRDKVVLVYMLMKGIPINVWAILRQNIMKFRNNLRWQFCYGGLITHFLRADGFKKEAVYLTVAFHPGLMGKIVYVTQTKALDTSHGPVMLAQERKAQDDITDEEMVALVDRYPLTESANFLCGTGPAFLEPLDDDEATTDEAMDEEDDDDAVNEEVNALMTRGTDSKSLQPFRIHTTIHESLQPFKRL
ncbi:hypothetical protein H5410_056316 [Solanum commersonii]|uniref:Putative plant transposon protein domain-containing protein n=1 Tax=Solanum commersonii TaxID=4109 RepID=A0A9J5WMS0_SOLCO|nr:hypothetical protein H5410_056316 [Solanum commersonii]